MSHPTNWDAAGQGLQDEIDAVSPLSSASSYTTPSIPAASIDGKAFRVTIAGISGASTVKLYVNGNQIFTFGMPGAGYLFVRDFLLIWSSSKAEMWFDGGSSVITSFNPSTLTFSTDSSHTVSSFTVKLV